MDIFGSRQMNPSNWLAAIGHTQCITDTIDASQVARVAAVLNLPAPALGSPLPALWHWAFFQNCTATAALGRDGHAARGDFIPAIELPNRMWAGSRIKFLRPLPVGSAAARVSTIENIIEKEGRTGSLVFVTLHHDYRVDGATVIIEEQDLVYRGAGDKVRLQGGEAPRADWSQKITPSAPLLFRYSAVTFNSHRIHYDHPYVTQTEGYPGLVIHGPLIATLMCQACMENNPGKQLRYFSFRGQRPLFSPDSFRVEGRLIDARQAEVWALNAQGVASAGTALFD